MKIHDIIKNEMKNKNISKKDLSKIIGCTTRAISYWENGERNISLKNADKILKALDISLNIGLKSDLD